MIGRVFTTSNQKSRVSSNEMGEIQNMAYADHSISIILLISLIEFATLLGFIENINPNGLTVKGRTSSK